jgi:hypothetical protein
VAVHPAGRVTIEHLVTIGVLGRFLLVARSLVARSLVARSLVARSLVARRLVARSLVIRRVT